MNIAIATGAILVISSVFIVLGLGGGILFVPILHWAGFDLQTVAIPLGLLLNGTNTLLALVPYGRERLVDWRGGWPMAVAAALTAPLGAYVQPRLAAATVLALFAVAVSLAAYRALRSAHRSGRKPMDGNPVPSPKLSVGLGVGAVVGFVGGLLGIGAGFVVAPAFMAMGYPPRRVAATTALVVTVCSFAGFAGYAPNLDLPWTVAIATAAAVIIGSQIGSRLMLRGAKPSWIAWGYVAILGGIAVKLLWEAGSALMP